ncbi:unnamed protein product [Bursaphelenchus okinawaensis]|uniref:RING-type E3 ubiquitin transferase n=1 Tax=Bursaphelenchus okinawaensis TaxID=465554 RepID=A0A811K6U4_9BILA|nr:unnamed protein product [Bursaphelenchus okinawaensis]CAG9092700.1 unnamed protein product [Bursaphelenchus okinawaensis]
MNGSMGQKGSNNRRRRPRNSRPNSESQGQPNYGVPPPGFENIEPPPQPRNQNRPNRGGRPRLGGQKSPTRKPTSQHVKERRDHNGKPFEGLAEDCDLCCQKSDVFGVGECLHPACMECVIRMRCLGEQKTCHACRTELDKVYFVRNPLNWKVYKIPNDFIVRHPDCGLFNVAFEDSYVMECYERYNLFSCKVCERRGEFSEFPTFPALKQHVTTHGLTFCHICLEHLNVLTKDRELYNQNDLKRHMNGEKGKLEGFKGHPQCNFCMQRFYDDEFQYRHLRKEHFYCSLCDTMFGKNLFFNRVEQLHRHYKQEHYPCLSPDCVAMGIVFKDEMELNVHNAQNHSGHNRSIPVDFQFNRNVSRFGETSGRGNQVVHLNTSSGVSVVPAREPVVNSPRQPTIIHSAQYTRQEPRTVPAPPRVQMNDFPSLAPSAAISNPNWRSSVQASRQQAQSTSVRQPLDLSSQFPTLGGQVHPTPTSSAPTSSGWGKKNIAAVLKQPAKPAPKKTAVPSESRKKVVPLPDIWPENMQKKLEAREQGLPEPSDIDPPLPDPLVALAKKKEPKKKTVKASIVMEKVKPTPIAEVNSKFNVFASVADDDSEDVATEEWLSSTAMKAKQKKKVAKQQEKERLQEERRKQKEEELKKMEERLTLEKFLKEKEEAELCKKLALKNWDDEGSDQSHTPEEGPETSKAAVENHQNTDDPLLRALMESNKQYAEERNGPPSALDRIKALTGWFAAPESNKSPERPNSSSPSIAPPPGFENVPIQKPPGL